MRILFFAQLKDITRCAEMQLTCAETDADGLWRAVLAAHPGLEPHRGSIRLAKNAEYAAPDARFTEADEIALIPPVSGG
ncbi:MAG TPA: MoaD/ThiS family protein [Verrucomicrobiota bacterium]|nr:MoaD/ThiS family protein [Verrucomicrobiota bacterium]HNT15434.1 MoaD/ThiS family protein [Verrucomicrobiota bacterium]